MALNRLFTFYYETVFRTVLNLTLLLQQLLKMNGERIAVVNRALLFRYSLTVNRALLLTLARIFPNLRNFSEKASKA